MSRKTNEILQNVACVIIMMVIVCVLMVVAVDALDHELFNQCLATALDKDKC